MRVKDILLRVYMVHGTYISNIRKENIYSAIRQPLKKIWNTSSLHALIIVVLYIYIAEKEQFH